MGFLDQLFGSELPLAVKFFVAFAVVLGLIALTAWAVRRFSGPRLIETAGGRARQPRLGLLEAFAIDGRRRLVLIRRDNVEHLIMIGGPNDVVVESQIVRAPPSREAVARAAQQAAAAQAQMAGGPAGPQAAPGAPMPQRPTLPPQGYAPGPMSQPRGPAPQPGPAPQRPPAPPLGGSSLPPAPAPAPMARPEAPRPPAPSTPAIPRATPTPPPPAKPAPMAPAAAPASASSPAKPRPGIDPLFADIEKKLEEALKRPAASAAASGEPPASRPEAGPIQPPPRPAAPPPPPAPSQEARPEPLAPSQAPRPASPLDSLEEEMANLLGRDATQERS